MKNRSSRRRAQIHVSETIAVLFIFFVLIFFGMIFYYKYQQVAVKEKGEEMMASRAMDTTLKVLFLPELICSKGEVEPEDNCIDVLKLRHANQTFQKYREDYYFQLFSYATISVHQLYPEGESKNYVLYYQPKPGFTRKEPTFFVVSLRDDTQKSAYGFGYIKVEVYS